MKESQELPQLKVGDRFMLPDCLPHLGKVELVRKWPKSWMVAEILPDGSLDPVPFCIAKSSLVGKTVTLIPF